MALLRGVESARAKYDNLRVELVMEYADRTRRCTVPCLLEQAGQQRRFEQFVGSCPQQGVVTVITGREAWSYRRKQYEDLEINDLARAFDTSTDLGFDPRVLGLDGIPISAKSTVPSLLWVETCDRAGIVGREELQGEPTWHVIVGWGDATTDFWIDEPLFRVHKCVTKAADIRVETDSEFDPADRTSPFPKRVEMTREDTKEWKQIIITVKSMEVDKPIPAERFTMKAMDVPVNTMLNDYRINRIVGYWDGNGVSKGPVHETHSAGPPPTPRNIGWIYAVTGVSLAVLGAAVAWLYFRQRKARSTGGG